MFLLVISCKRNQNTELNDGDAEMEINAEDLPKRVVVNTKSNDILQNWPEFVAFDNRFDAIYNITNNEDLILLVVDLIEKQKQWEESTYPEAFDVAQIRSRQQVVKTYLLKIKSALDYRDDFKTPTIEFRVLKYLSILIFVENNGYLNFAQSEATNLFSRPQTVLKHFPLN